MRPVRIVCAARRSRNDLSAKTAVLEHPLRKVKHREPSTAIMSVVVVFVRLDGEARKLAEGPPSYRQPA